MKTELCMTALKNAVKGIDRPRDSFIILIVAFNIAAKNIRPYSKETR